MEEEKEEKHFKIYQEVCRRLKQIYQEVYRRLKPKLLPSTVMYIGILVAVFVIIVLTVLKVIVHPEITVALITALIGVTVPMIITTQLKNKNRYLTALHEKNTSLYENLVMVLLSSLEKDVINKDKCLTDLRKFMKVNYIKIHLNFPMSLIAEMENILAMEEPKKNSKEDSKKDEKLNKSVGKCILIMRQQIDYKRTYKYFEVIEKLNKKKSAKNESDTETNGRPSYIDF